MTNWTEVWKRALWTFAEALFGAAVGVAAYLSTLDISQEWAIVLAIVSATLAAIGKNYFTEREVVE